MIVSNLTLARLRSNITHALQGGSVPAQLDQDELINEAGELFYSLHQWNFRLRPPVTIDLIAGQSHIDFPDDFGSMVAYSTVNGLNNGIQMTTPHGLAAKRATSITVTQNYYWATMVQPSQPERRQSPGPPRWEIWPPVSSTSLDQIVIWYLAKWQPMIETTDVADVPSYAVPALISFVRAYASGLAERLLEPSGGGEHGMIAHVMEGPIWDAAVTQDGLLMSDYGIISGGAIESLQPHFSWRSASASPVANPS